MNWFKIRHTTPVVGSSHLPLVKKKSWPLFYTTSTKSFAQGKIFSVLYAQDLFHHHYLHSSIFQEADQNDDGIFGCWKMQCCAWIPLYEHRQQQQQHTKTGEGKKKLSHFFGAWHHALWQKNINIFEAIFLIIRSSRAAFRKSIPGALQPILVPHNARAYLIK